MLQVCKELQKTASEQSILIKKNTLYKGKGFQKRKQKQTKKSVQILKNERI